MTRNRKKKTSKTPVLDHLLEIDGVIYRATEEETDGLLNLLRAIISRPKITNAEKELYARILIKIKDRPGGRLNVNNGEFGWNLLTSCFAE